MTTTPPPLTKLSTESSSFVAHRQQNDPPLLTYPSPFVRPHPIIWTFTLTLNIVYILLLLLLLSYPLDTARQLMRYVDSSLGQPLEERDYAEDCTFGLKIIWEAVDIFCLAHALGWFGKALILRDYWFCWILSVAFELAEYSLEHQLANFKECWWDHWILDVLICNWIGTWIGMKTCQLLMVKPYEWRGASTPVPSPQTRKARLKSKAKRALRRLRPHDFTRFTWRPFVSLRNYICTVALLAAFLVAELSPFYLKALLWMEPSHPIVITRLVFIFLWGLPTVRELYDYIDSPSHAQPPTENAQPSPRKQHMHLPALLTTLTLELILIFKWGWFEGTEFSEPFPLYVKIAWGLGVLLVSGYGVIVWVKSGRKRRRRAPKH